MSKELVGSGGAYSDSDVSVEDLVSMRARTAIASGTCVVFSNYQLVHRVLTMVNRKHERAHRDFVACFVVDQREPLPTTASHPIKLCDRNRKLRLAAQLQPSGMLTCFPCGPGFSAVVRWGRAGPTHPRYTRAHTTVLCRVSDDECQATSAVAVCDIVCLRACCPGCTCLVCAGTFLQGSALSGMQTYSTGNGSAVWLGWHEDQEAGGAIRVTPRSCAADNVLNSLTRLNFSGPVGRGASFANEDDAWVVDDGFDALGKHHYRGGDHPCGTQSALGPLAEAVASDDVEEPLFSYELPI